MCVARRTHYLEFVQSGMSFTQAARAMGVSKRTGKTWRNGRAGSTGCDKKPSVDRSREDMEEPKRIRDRHLDQDERLRMADMLRLDRTIAEIAVAPGRSKLTISCEPRRSKDPASGGHIPRRAQRLSARPRKALDYAPLHDHVREKLGEHRSPERISRRLKLDFPDNERMRACPETICQTICIQTKGRLKLDSSKWLRSGRAKRRPGASQDARKSCFREPMAMVSERPAEAGDRAVPGRWGAT